MGDGQRASKGVAAFQIGALKPDLAIGRGDRTARSCRGGPSAVGAIDAGARIERARDGAVRRGRHGAFSGPGPNGAP